LPDYGDSFVDKTLNLVSGQGFISNQERDEVNYKEHYDSISQNKVPGECEAQGTCVSKEMLGLNAQVTPILLAGSPGKISARSSRTSITRIRVKTSKPTVETKIYADSATSSKQFTKLVKSIQKNGLLDPVIDYTSIGGKNYIVAGNMRTYAAKLLGKTDELIFRKVNVPFRNYKSNSEVIEAAATAELGMPIYKGPPIYRSQ